MSGSQEQVAWPGSWAGGLHCPATVLHDSDYQVGCPCSDDATPSRLACKYIYLSCTCIWWGALPFCCGIISDFVSICSPSPSHNAHQHPSSRSSPPSSNLSLSHQVTLPPSLQPGCHSRSTCTCLNLTSDRWRWLCFLLSKMTIDIIQCHSMCFFLYILQWDSIPFYSRDRVQCL